MELCRKAGPTRLPSWAQEQTISSDAKQLASSRVGQVCSGRPQPAAIHADKHSHGQETAGQDDARHACHIWSRYEPSGAGAVPAMPSGWAARSFSSWATGFTSCAALPAGHLRTAQDWGCGVPAQPGVHMTALQKTAVGAPVPAFQPMMLDLNSCGASLSYVTCSRSHGGWSAFPQPTMGPQQSPKTPGRMLELHSRCIHPGAGSVSHEGWCQSISSSASCWQRYINPEALVSASTKGGARAWASASPVSSAVYPPKPWLQRHRKGSANVSTSTPPVGSAILTLKPQSQLQLWVQRYLSAALSWRPAGCSEPQGPLLWGLSRSASSRSPSWVCSRGLQLGLACTAQGDGTANPSVEHVAEWRLLQHQPGPPKHQLWPPSKAHNTSSQAAQTGAVLCWVSLGTALAGVADEMAAWAAHAPWAACLAARVSPEGSCHRRNLPMFNTGLRCQPLSPLGGMESTSSGGCRPDFAHQGHSASAGAPQPSQGVGEWQAQHAEGSGWKRA